MCDLWGLILDHNAGPVDILIREPEEKITSWLETKIIESTAKCQLCGARNLRNGSGLIIRIDNPNNPKIDIPIVVESGSIKINASYLSPVWLCVYCSQKVRDYE